jgi:hypothetical protein
MEYAPDLQFKHYTVAEARLPADALMTIPNVPLSAVAICCDLERPRFLRSAYRPEVSRALRDTHWYELAEWTSSGPGSAAVVRRTEERLASLEREDVVDDDPRHRLARLASATAEMRGQYHVRKAEQLLRHVRLVGEHVEPRTDSA